MTGIEVGRVRRGSVVGADEIEALTTLIDGPDPLSQGIHRPAFEEQFRAHVGRRHAMSTTSGTVALEFAVHLLDLQPGDEVVVTPQTYQATIQPLLDHDVTVRFCDVRPDNLNLDPERLAELVGPRTRAILLVDYGGWPADLDAVLDVAREHGAVVVEDCAHALGASQGGVVAGGRADIACYSFHASKNITTLGEGGMLVFDRDHWADRIERIRGNETDCDLLAEDVGALSLPASPPGAIYVGDSYTHRCREVRRSGTNATLSEAAALVGSVQLAKLTKLVERRGQVASHYTDALDGVPGVRVPGVPADVVHPYHFFTFFVDDDAVRHALLDRVGRQGIELQQRYFPLHLQPEWRARGHGPGECPVAERLWFTSQVNLPCSPVLTDEQVEHVATTVAALLRHRPIRTNGGTR